MPIFHHSSIDALLNINFEHGTLVEYVHGAGFGQEYQRHRITKVAPYPEGVAVHILLNAPSEAIYFIHFRNWSVQQKNGLFYFLGRGIWNYVLAPRGVSIPPLIPAKGRKR